jgi:hypothetical protein
LNHCIDIAAPGGNVGVGELFPGVGGTHPAALSPAEAGRLEKITIDRGQTEPSFDP